MRVIAILILFVGVFAPVQLVVPNVIALNGWSLILLPLCIAASILAIKAAAYSMEMSPIAASRLSLVGFLYFVIVIVSILSSGSWDNISPAELVVMIGFSIGIGPYYAWRSSVLSRNVKG